jgi:hypothetical protein
VQRRAETSVMILLGAFSAGAQQRDRFVHVFQQPCFADHSFSVQCALHSSGCALVLTYHT